jgi:hypothetical protein
MVPSVAPCAIAAATRSISPPIRKLAGRLLGCTYAATLWFNGSVDELWAHERYSYHLKQHEWGPQEAPPAGQRDRRQTRTKPRHGTQDQVHQKQGKANQSAKQKAHTKTARHRRPETKNATKTARSKPIRLSRSKATGGGNLKTAHAKSRTKTVEHRRPENKNATKAARSKSVRHSRFTASGRGNPKAAQAKSRTKTLEHRRQQTKAANRTRNQSKSAGHQQSAASNGNDKTTRAATDRRSRTKTGQHRQQPDKIAINHLAPTRSAEAATVPTPSPRLTGPAPVNVTEAAILDPAPTGAPVPQRINVRKLSKSPIAPRSSSATDWVCSNCRRKSRA